ncbi:hypothetical protein [Frondihabitans sucicola]|uniref:hypothetical protein n=1 Tax=Frondihabitans sucicola TaxID=1268041 RepID=UPI0025741A65|nr:hypothetical protein [Frondihabitans sucicola]
MSPPLHVFQPFRGNRRPLRSELVHVTHLDFPTRDDRGTHRPAAHFELRRGALR